MLQTPTELVTGNHFDKFRSKNLVHQFLVRGFLHAARQLIATAKPLSVLEVGCGPGDLAGQLFPQHSATSEQYLGTDICPVQIATAQERYPHLSFQQSDAYDLPVADRTFDLCLACEVLEHLDDPTSALEEFSRVTRKYLLVSVPWEPIWRILNCLRGQYWGDWGNTPGHVQHFNRRRIQSLVRKRFELVEERRPFPWTMLLAKRRD